MSTLHLQKLAHGAINYLTNIFSLSISTEQMPEIWHQAIIIPILKPARITSSATTGAHLFYCDQRPKRWKSSCCPKYFHIHFYPAQLGFRPKHSTCTALSTIQIGAGLYAVGRPVQKRNDEDGQVGTIQSLPLERGALFNRFFGEPAHGPPHVAGGASGSIGGCRDESRTDNPDLDMRHVFDRNNRKTDLI